MTSVVWGKATGCPGWRRVAPLLAALWVAVPVGSSMAAASFEATRAAHTPSETRIVDRHGAPLQRLRTDNTVRRGQWIALADVSPALRTALVLSEDRRFHEHSGVDWRAVSAAAWGNLWDDRTRGASTLTMQLAGLLDEDLRREAGGRSVARKIGQTVSAQLLERHWRKDQILEAYLNLVPLRGELVGIDALSRTLFDKAAHGLDEREAAITAALVRAPNAATAVVARRACEVLAQVQGAAGARSTRAAKPDCSALEMFTEAALQRRAFGASEGIAPHFARELVGKYRPASPGALLRSTVHAPLQRVASEALQRQLRELRGRHIEDGAVVVLDNATGEVLAWVGSSGTLSRAAEVDGVTALRQPGSTLKPFLYAQAIAERRLTAASLLEDAGTHIPTTGGLYIPQNYDQRFKGWVSVRTALGASLNVPAVRALGMVSPDAFHRQLKALGLPLKESGDYYGYSLALGSAEVSLLALSNAYRALANGGRASPVSFTLSAKPAKPASTPALDPRAAFIVTDILADPIARARTFGTDSVLATRFWTAVKTGTSKDMRDNWALGFSQHYTVGVWVGNASGAPMWDVSGTTGAAPVWTEVMNHLHHTLPSHEPRPPAGLVRIHATFGNSGDGAPIGEAPRSEWFLQGTGQTLFAGNAGTGKSVSASRVPVAPLAATASSTPRILAPASGTIIALDPDIPADHQRLTFRAEGAQLRWQMDGKPFARGPQAQWLPWPGRHVVRLTDARGTVLDEIRLEVRGAGVRSQPSR